MNIPQRKPPTAPVASTLAFQKPSRTNAGHRIILYGTGGVGKTTLACSMPGPVAFFDLDESLSRLVGSLEERNLMENVSTIGGITTWQQLRNTLQSDGWDGIKTIVIDTVTKAEELSVEHTLQHVPHEKGHSCKSIEDYGFGKGFTFVFDTFLPLLGDLDRHSRQGRNIVLICHDCISNVPNPSGEDWIRYEPRLQSPNSGKASIRLRCKEWADHVLFMAYDVATDKDGKGKGCGSRSLYTVELPSCMAKSRTFQGVIPMDDGTNVWEQIIK